MFDPCATPSCRLCISRCRQRRRLCSWYLPPSPVSLLQVGTPEAAHPAVPVALAAGTAWGPLPGPASRCCSYLRLLPPRLHTVQAPPLADSKAMQTATQGRIRGRGMRRVRRSAPCTRRRRSSTSSSSSPSKGGCMEAASLPSPAVPAAVAVVVAGLWSLPLLLRPPRPRQLSLPQILRPCVVPPLIVV